MTDGETLIAIAKIAKANREATGMPSEVFHATVRGNIEQGYNAHVTEMVAKGYITSRVPFHDAWSWDGGLEIMCYHHESKELAKNMPKIS